MFDGVDRRVSRVDLSGVNGYDLTGWLLAWAATSLAYGAVDETGALGPVQAFGLDRLAEAFKPPGPARVEIPGVNFKNRDTDDVATVACASSSKRAGSCGRPAAAAAWDINGRTRRPRGPRKRR